MRLVPWLLLILLAPTACLRAADLPPVNISITATQPAEAELGRKTAERIEKDYKLVKDDALVTKLNGMAAQIAPFTQRPDVVYTCKILDTQALNAMAIPGGGIYFTKGLLDAVESDHEIAGVMAHEIAHNSLYHQAKMAKRATRADLTQLIAIVTGAYIARDADINPGELLTMSEVVKQALLNGYSVDLESEADMNAVEYLYKLKTYDPVGLYSVMLGFEQIENHHPAVVMGYLKTHPDSDERKEQLERKYAELNIPLTLWHVVNFRADTAPPKKEQTGATLRLGGVEIVTLTVADGACDALTRVNEAASAINRRLARDEIQQFDVDLDLYNNQAVIRLRGIPVLTLTPADAEAAKIPLHILGAQAVQSLKDAIWREKVKRS